jgi:para-nitrobenzyl esterase
MNPSTDLRSLALVLFTSLALVLFTSLAAGCATGGVTGGPNGTIDGVTGAPNGTIDIPRGTPISSESAPASGAAAPVVVTTDGPVRGRRAGQTDAFSGIPFAAPPIGTLRWRPPAAVTPWSAPRDATAFASQCPQLDAQTQAVVGNEDCLYLNVWAPHANAAPRPVLVFIHGGGHFEGSASKQSNGAYIYDGEYLAEHGDAVVVTLNYRLGALGFLAQPALLSEGSTATTGNYGVLDQIAALAWVKANIAAFGGDPARVLLFGESAGAFDTCVHVASPLSAGLFSRALMESGECVAATLTDAEAEGDKVAAAVGCDAAADPMACLRGVSAESLVTNAPGSLGNNSQGVKYLPTIDGHVVSESPLSVLGAGKANRVPFVVGSNADEGALFLAKTSVPTALDYWAMLVNAYGTTSANQVLLRYPAVAYSTPKAAAIAVYTDSIFTSHARRIARSALAGGFTSVHRYFFTHTLESGPGSSLGAYHSLELLFVFHNFPFAVSPAEMALSDQLIGYWTRFASTGDPNGASAVAWPSYTPADDYLQLDEGIAAGQGVRPVLCDFWDTVP